MEKHEQSNSMSRVVQEQIEFLIIILLRDIFLEMLAVSALAVFTGSFVKGIRNPTCFVAGTIVLTAGLTAIEHIRAGDKVISTDPGTGETAEKTVLKTYLRETDRLVHLTVKGEEIITTVSHPFYVKGRGFVNAGELWVGAGLLDVKGNLEKYHFLKLSEAGVEREKNGWEKFYGGCKKVDECSLHHTPTLSYPGKWLKKNDIC